MTPTYDIFISYKRKSLATANNLYYRLTTRGYSAFFDLDEMRSNNFDEQLFRYIDSAKDVFVLLETGSLDGAKKSNWEREDWFCIEIAYALKKKKNIIPLMLNGFTMPEMSSLPVSLQELVKKNAPEFSFSFFDDYLDKLEELGYISSQRQQKRDIFAAFKFYSNGDCLIYQDGKLVSSVSGNTDVSYFLPVSHKGDYRFKCVLPETQKSIYLNERIDANEEKVVEIKWSKFALKAERRHRKRTEIHVKNRWWEKLKYVLEMIGYITLSLAGLGIVLLIPDNPPSEDLLKSRDRCLGVFETHYKNSNIDNIDALQDACTYLDSIQMYESGNDFEGEKVYPEKSQALSRKAAILYQIADGKYQRAPEGSATKQKLLEKRNRIQSIQKNIEK